MDNPLSLAATLVRERLEVGPSANSSMLFSLSLGGGSSARYGVSPWPRDGSIMQQLTPSPPPIIFFSPSLNNDIGGSAWVSGIQSVRARLLYAILPLRPAFLASSVTSFFFFLFLLPSVARLPVLREFETVTTFCSSPPKRLILSLLYYTGCDSLPSPAVRDPISLPPLLILLMMVLEFVLLIFFSSFLVFVAFCF